jgi:hypothetical protein
MEANKLSSNPPLTFWLGVRSLGTPLAGTGRYLVGCVLNIFDGNGEIQTADGSQTARPCFTSMPD